MDCTGHTWSTNHHGDGQVADEERVECLVYDTLPLFDACETSRDALCGKEAAEAFVETMFGNHLGWKLLNPAAFRTKVQTRKTDWVIVLVATAHQGRAVERAKVKL